MGPIKSVKISASGLGFVIFGRFPLFVFFHGADVAGGERATVRDSGRVYRLSCGRTSDWMI